MEDQILVTLINYGIAGVVIYMFYSLISQKLEKLNDEIEKLTQEIIRLREAISRANSE